MPSAATDSERRPRRRLAVERIWPRHAIPGGRLDIGGRGFAVDQASRLRVFFGEREAHVSRVSSTRIGVRVPENAGGEVRVAVGGRETEPFAVVVGRPVAENLHIVANPVYDRRGRLYATFSGRRSERVPNPLYRLRRRGDPEPLGEGIVNPTGLAWGPDDTLYVSSREDGRVYRMDGGGAFQVFAEELGCATGITFAPDGRLLVGDRDGALYQMEGPGAPVEVFSRLRPSISAYHLAFNSEGGLFVAGPTLSSRDQIVEFGPGGEPCRVHCGFGRPQGLVFDRRDRCFVAEGLAGDAGVFLFTPVGARRIISGPPVVGVALDHRGALAVATSDTIYEFTLDRELLGLPPDGEPSAPAPDSPN